MSRHSEFGFKSVLELHPKYVTQQNL